MRRPRVYAVPPVPDAIDRIVAAGDLVEYGRSWLRDRSRENADA